MKTVQASGCLLLAALCWGSSNVAQKTVLDHIGPFTATALTSVLGAAVILPMAMRERRTTKLDLRVRTGELLVVVTLFAISITLLQAGFGGTTVTNAGFLVNTNAILTPIAAWLLFREWPPLTVWPAALLAMSGLWLMQGAIAFDLRWGDVLCLLSACCFALWYPLVARFLVRTSVPVQLTVLQFLGAALLAGLSSFALETTDPSSLLASVPDLIVVGILSKGLAYVLQSIGQQHVPPTSAAIIVSAEAVFGAIAAALLLGEGLSRSALCGAVLVFAGIILAQLPIGMGSLTAAWHWHSNGVEQTKPGSAPAE